MSTKKRIILAIAGVTLLGGGLYALFYGFSNFVEAVPNEFVEASAVLTDQSAVEAGIADPSKPAHGVSADRAHRSDISAREIKNAVPLRKRRRALDEGLKEFAADVDGLRQRAKNGDLQAMKALYNNLKICADAPHDQEEIQTELESVSLNKNGEPDHQAIDSRRTFQTRLFNLCRRAGSEPESELYYWLKAAAATGDSDAKFDFVLMGAPHRKLKRGIAVQRHEHQKLGKAYLKEELAKGNPEALLVSSYSYGGLDGIYRGDRIEEYAYLYAFMLTGGNGNNDVFYTSLASMKNRLSEASVAQAIARGEQLVDECCRRK